MGLDLAQPNNGLADKANLGKAVDQFKSLIQPAILVVDRDAVATANISALLHTKDHCVEVAHDCTAAIKAVTRDAYDLVIADQSLAADTGVSLADLIHAIPEAADIPFLFTSDNQGPDVISRPNRNRNEFIIRKPFDHEAFLELVEYAMWMPHLIRSHILRIHQQQGLSQPHIDAVITGKSQSPASPFPDVGIGAISTSPLSQPQ